jgi:N-acyl homoserine lactone hydrolase
MTPVRLYLMQVAFVPPENTPAVCYLVQTGDGKNILIDSGIPHPFDPPPHLANVVIGKDVIEQLAEIGLQPADIDILICTHFDMDHAGRHSMFLNAEWIVQRAHYEHALRHPRFKLTRHE